MYRLAEEAQVLTGAGSLTTANTVDTVIYHLISNPSCLSRLVAELKDAFPEPATMPTLAEVEKLTYLTAVIYEGLRLNTGVAHRLSRISPDVSYIATLRFRAVWPWGCPCWIFLRTRTYSPTLMCLSRGGGYRSNTGGGAVGRMKITSTAQHSILVIFLPRLFRHAFIKPLRDLA